MNNYKLYIHILPNNKVYVGITCKAVETRWRKNGEGYAKHRYFWRAIQKYGWDNIQHIVLADHLSKDWACKLEQELIRELKANEKEFGYNLSLGGEFNAGFHYKRTSEWIERQREMMIGTHHSEETKRKLSEINRNRDPAIREKISQSLKKSGAERAAKRKETLRRKHPDGIHLSDEHKAKLSVAMRGKKKSEETKAKMRKPKSPETVEKMREAQRISHKARKLGMTYKEYKEQQLTNLVGGQ